MKRFQIMFLLVMFPITSYAVDNVSIHFDTAKSEIKASELEDVEVAAEQIKRDNAVVVIVGHADQRGSRLYNLDLGNKRAQSVRNKLKELGVKDEQLIVSVSYGKEKPLAPVDGKPDHLAQNRVVEIVPVKALASKEVVKEVQVPVEVKTEVKQYAKNRISLFGGFAPLGLNQYKKANDHFVLEQNYVPSFGLAYSRNFTYHWNWELSAFTNNSYYGSLGYNF